MRSDRSVPIGVCVSLAVLALGWIHSAQPVQAIDIVGTIQFSGQISFAAPIAGIDSSDIEVRVSTTTEATGNGEKCEILSVASDTADAGGAYPDSGAVSAQIEIGRGGPQNPTGDCVITLQARGTDGVSVSARGSRTVFVSADDISSNAAMNVDITVRESKAIAGIDKECFKWAKRQLARGAKCNFLLLKKGPDAAPKCKDGGPQPPGCDPGDHVGAMFALAYDDNDQRLDPPNAEGIDFKALKPQLICQKRFGKAAGNFVKKRLRLVQRKCVDAVADSEACREQQSKDSKKKLDQIDKCTATQEVDQDTGRVVPQVGAPCDVCIDNGGNIDRKCLKACFQIALGELSDGVIGDVPVCGDGILQSGESCDDGNLVDGDCCSSSCTAENLGDQSCGVGECEVTVPMCQLGQPVTCTPGSPGVEGPDGDPTCSDGLDNDCDGLIDAADPDCQ